MFYLTNQMIKEYFEHFINNFISQHLIFHLVAQKIVSQNSSSSSSSIHLIYIYFRIFYQYKLFIYSIHSWSGYTRYRFNKTICYISTYYCSCSTMFSHIYCTFIYYQTTMYTTKYE